ncbi:hypothetical protein [Candidimonas nitroreducens]|uniref:Monooxygenase n=1 Tax=Candidimonas nitroreducens TaxID=683354 RepID=A0A225MW49_9BURK|nr:hypothetical protein [Candidimonas nitroreducens]OWT63801.1 hypothetical protein CEY11_05685 [Candidimonas nitroreducens]
MLARYFEACQESIEKALQLYENTRRERTAKIVRSSAAQVTRVHSSELANPEGSAQYVAREWGNKEVGDRYQWIYGYDARTAPLGES